VEDGGLSVLAFSPDSKRLAAAGRSVRVWNTTGWSHAFDAGSPGIGYGTVRFSPDGRLIVTGNVKERVEFLGCGVGEGRAYDCCMSMQGDLAFSPDGGKLAMGGVTRVCGTWPGTWRSAPRADSRAGVGAIVFSPDGRTLVTGSRDGVARTWDSFTGKPLRETSQQADYIDAVAVHPAGALVAFVVRKGPAMLWDLSSGSAREVAPVAFSNVAFSPDGRWLAFAVPRPPSSYGTLPQGARASPFHSGPTDGASLTMFRRRKIELMRRLAVLAFACVASAQQAPFTLDQVMGFAFPTSLAAAQPAGRWPGFDDARSVATSWWRSRPPTRGAGSPRYSIDDAWRSARLAGFRMRRRSSTRGAVRRIQRSMRQGLPRRYGRAPGRDPHRGGSAMARRRPCRLATGA